MTTLADGLCVVADDDSPWTNPVKSKWRAVQARELCRDCPVLRECSDFAALHRWAGVNIAGWAAPSPRSVMEGLRPPWIDDPSRHPLIPATLAVARHLEARR